MVHINRINNNNNNNSNNNMTSATSSYDVNTFVGGGIDAETSALLLKCRLAIEFASMT
jgi:hypothetical protein